MNRTWLEAMLKMVDEQSKQHVTQHMMDSVKLSLELINLGEQLDYRDLAHVPIVYSMATALLFKILNPALEPEQYMRINKLQLEFIEGLVGEVHELQDLIAEFHIQHKGMVGDTQLRKGDNE